MTVYVTEPMLAVTTGPPVDLVRGATGQFFAPTDTSFATPIAVQTLDGITLTSVTATADGFIPPLKLPMPTMVWKSGPYMVVVQTFKGAVEAAQSAVALAQAAADSADEAAAVAAAATAVTTSQINTHLGGDAAGLVGRVIAVETGKADLVSGKVPLSQLPTLSGSMTDATVSAKGAVRLSGDLGGTADSPTVPGLAGKADDSAVVKLAGAQNIAGQKTFTSIPIVPDGSFGIAKLNATGTPDATKFLRGDGQWVTVSGTVTYGTTGGTAAEGNDGRITGAAQKASNLSDLANAATARANLGLTSPRVALGYSGTGWRYIVNGALTGSDLTAHPALPVEFCWGTEAQLPSWQQDYDTQLRSA